MISDESVKRRYERFNGDVFSFQRALFFLDERCDGACDYCFEREKRNVTASLETAQRVIDTLKLVERRKMAPQLHLFGGEPTLHPNFDAVLGYAARRNVGVTLYTNGAFREEVLDSILRHKAIIRHVQVSIDGVREAHEKMRRGAGGGSRYDRIIENFRALVAAGIDAYSHGVLCRETIEHLEESAVFLAGLGSGKNPPIFNVADPLSWTDEDVEKYTGQLEALARRTLDQFRQAIEHPNGLPRGGYPCIWGSGLVGLCVSADGDLFVCHLHYFGLKDKGLDPRDHKIGDLERGIDWPKLEAFRGASVDMMPGCGDCKGYGCNPRVCMMANRNDAGDYFTPHPRVCRVYKAAVGVFDRFGREARRLEPRFAGSGRSRPAEDAPSPPGSKRGFQRRIHEARSRH